MIEGDQFPAIQFFPSPVILLKNDRSLVTMNQYAINLIEDMVKVPVYDFFGFDPVLSFLAQELDRFFRAKQIENLVTMQIDTKSGAKYFQVSMRKRVGYASAPNYMLIVFTEILTVEKVEDLLQGF